MMINSLLSALVVALAFLLLAPSSVKSVIPNDALLMICCDSSEDSFLTETYPTTGDSSTLGEFTNFLEFTEFHGFVGIHVNTDQTLWGLAVTDFNTLYKFGPTVPLAFGETFADATFNVLSNNGDPVSNGFNTSIYEFELWDSISFGGLAGDCNGRLYSYDFFNRFLQSFNPTTGFGQSVNAFSPVSPFNLAFVNRFASTANNFLISAWFDRGYDSEDSFYVSPLTLYVATLDISKNPPQMSVQTQPFFDYFTIWPFAMDNIEISSDGNYLYMLAFYVGGYLNTNFTQFDTPPRRIQEEKRNTMLRIQKHAQELAADHKRNLGLQTRREREADKKSGYQPAYTNMAQMRRSMRNLMRGELFAITQSIITINLQTLTVVQTTDIDSSDEICYALTLKKNRCTKS